MPQQYPDIPRIYTAIAEIGACVYYALLLRRKPLSPRFFLLSTFALIFQCTFLPLTGNVPLQYWLICMCVAIAVMYIYLFLVLDSPPLVSGYYCINAFLLAEFMASLEWQLVCFFDFSTAKPPVIRGLFLLLVYGTVFLLSYLSERSLRTGDDAFRISGRDFFAALMVALLAFFFSNLNFVYGHSPFSGSTLYDIFNVRTLVDLAGLLILRAFHSRISELHAERELDAIHNVLRAQYEKYRSYQDSVDLINMKYHDLKHQMEGLRTAPPGEERDRWIEVLEKELADYAPKLQTGNTVLDTMIDSRSATCAKNKITLTAVADGELLDILHVADICTIFGNALDNAIENTASVEDPKKRLIRLTVSRKKDFVHILVENYCDHEVLFRNGLPATTKKDRSNHGFGLKSILHTVEKYGGTMRVSAESGWFYLNILLPS